MANLIPDYLNVDFNTLVERLREQLGDSNIFKDYDYEGSNISTLIELFAYIGELYTFYVNKIAKNAYIDTSDLYENVHRLSHLRGYSPHGYKSADSSVNVSVTMSDGVVDAEDELYIYPWYKFESGESTDDGDDINYSIVSAHTETIPTTASGSHSFDVNLKQGEYEINEFSGDDIVDNELILPKSNYDHNTNSVEVYVSGTKWERVEDWTNDITALSLTDNVYTISYNKYKQFVIEFSSARNVPTDTDSITTVTLVSLGEDGDLAANSIDSFEATNDVPILTGNEIEEQEKYFIYNLTKDSAIATGSIAVNSSAASTNSSDPETTDDIREDSYVDLFSQKRNVTKEDYEGHLEQNSEVVKASVWGEEEENEGNTTSYYKVYISVVPDSWSTSTISTSANTWTLDGTDYSIILPQEYSTNFETDLKTFLEERKMLNVFEVFVVPQIVNFRLIIGIKKKRTYNWTAVKTAVKDKLEQYFKKKNRAFGETIDFKEIWDYITDTTISIEDSNYDQYINGIKNLVIRDIDTYTPSLSGDTEQIFDYNTKNNFPMFTEDEGDLGNYYNILSPIVLGRKQFPILVLDACEFINEG